MLRHVPCSTIPSEASSLLFLWFLPSPFFTQTFFLLLLLYQFQFQFQFYFVQEHEGYPSGSMVDFACHEDGSPILAVSSLAVHSKVLFFTYIYFVLQPLNEYSSLHNDHDFTLLFVNFRHVESLCQCKLLPSCGQGPRRQDWYCHHSLWRCYSSQLSHLSLSKDCYNLWDLRINHNLMFNWCLFFAILILFNFHLLLWFFFCLDLLYFDILIRH